MSRALGAAAEQLAARYLLARGYRILATNYTCQGGELDLVAEEGPTLVFVEVRSRRSSAFGGAAETVGPIKRKRLIHAASHYLGHQCRGAERPCRFDLVAIDAGEITHIQDAFEV
jgi:putative endonuclease